MERETRRCLNGDGRDGCYVALIYCVEDDESIRELVGYALQAQKFDVKTFADGASFWKALEGRKPDLVLLDIMLPGIDGFSVCTALREKGNIPIIILSARSGKEDKIRALEYGADDYIEKPFDVDLLIAKIRALLRRNYEMTQKGELLTDGNLTLDEQANLVYLDHKPLVMSNKEFLLLTVFLQNKGKVLRKEWLFDTVWGMDSFSEPSTLTVHINKIREKIEDDPKKPRRITTVWGTGYKYEAIQ